MRRFLDGHDVKGYGAAAGCYWDTETAHMEEDHLLRRFTGAICDKEVNYDHITIIAKTF